MNNTVIGLDEAGRGAWAGPLVASAVALESGENFEYIDSKALTAIRRNKLALHCRQSALAIGIGWVSAGQVDKLGLTTATSKAMSLALEQIRVKSNQITIDGNIQYIEEGEAVIKADQKIPAVSAASIIAKTTRDAYMAQMSSLYPKYGFDMHVGYGVALHAEALANYGVTPLHRQSFKPVSKYL